MIPALHFIHLAAAEAERRPGFFTWSDWTRGDILGGLGLVAGVIGLGIAIWQIIKARRAAEGIEQAVLRTETRMATSHIALLLPQIQLAATDIDEFSADRDADVKLAVRTLSNVTRLARDLATLLEAREEDVDVSRMVELLRDAAAEASTSKTRLINDNVLPKTATKNLRPVMDELTGEIRGLALKLVTT